MSPALNRVHLRDMPATPWRNGGGTTRDLLTWPRAGAGWQLRVSVALIDRSGPFSMFGGVTRWFTVLDGAGVRLSLLQGLVTLRPGDPPLRFDGDDAPGCELIDGATHDLNFMAPRDAGVARMQSAGPGSRIAGHTRWRALYSTAHAVVKIGGVEHIIDPAFLLWSDGGDARGESDWQLVEAAGPAWWLSLEP